MPEKSKTMSSSTKTRAVTQTSKKKKLAYPRGTRPAIPEQTKRELWARAAGRCQVHGCNEILYYDSVTKQRANLATIAHIVAFSPDGPRGHATRSKALEVEIENLMLTCKKHGDLIDDLNYIDEYPLETLTAYKTDHEQRVREATAALDDAKTHLLLIQAPVTATATIIDTEEAKRAVRPRWPGDERSVLIDLNTLTLSKKTPSYWEAAKDQISTGIRDLLRPRPGVEGIKHLSVFAIAPIPLLVLTGHLLSSRVDADLFQAQRHRPSKKWCWTDGQPGVDEGFDFYTPDESVEVEDVVIVASVSGVVDRAAASQAVGRPHVLYEIRAQTPGPDFLKYRSQLSEFGVMFRHTLTCIRRDFRRAQRLHFVFACPASMAIESGRSLIENADPEILIYQADLPQYHHVLTINQKADS